MANNRIGNVNRGFTLVELLVVIGIIALLISILLPTLSRARSAASTLKCLSNLKQLATASIMYENDNRGVLPMVGYRGQGAGSFWPNALVQGRYINGTSNSSASTDKGRQSTFQCPQGETLAIANNGNTNPFTVGNIGQIADLGMMNYQNVDFPTNPNSVITSDYAANGIQPYNATGLTKNRPTSEYFPFIVWPSDADLLLTTTIRPAQPKVSGIKGSALIAMYFDGVYCHDRSTKYMTLRHGKPNGSAIERSSNFVFLDGHAETIKSPDMPSEKRGDNMYDNTRMSNDNFGVWKVRFVIKPMN